jgi:hypothetical protein
MRRKTQILNSGTQSIYWGRKYAKMEERRIPKTMSTVLPTLRAIVPIDGGTAAYLVRVASGFSIVVTGIAFCRQSWRAAEPRQVLFRGSWSREKEFLEQIVFPKQLGLMEVKGCLFVWKMDFYVARRHVFRPSRELPLFMK